MRQEDCTALLVEGSRSAREFHNMGLRNGGFPEHGSRKNMYDYIIPGTQYYTRQGVIRAKSELKYMDFFINELGLKVFEITAGEFWESVKAEVMKVLDRNIQWLKEQGQWTKKRKRIPADLI